jgi:hypothetical protein
MVSTTVAVSVLAFVALATCPFSDAVNDTHWREELARVGCHVPSPPPLSMDELVAQAALISRSAEQVVQELSSLIEQRAQLAAMAKNAQATPVENAQATLAECENLLRVRHDTWSTSERMYTIALGCAFAIVAVATYDALRERLYLYQLKAESAR